MAIPPDYITNHMENYHLAVLAVLIDGSGKHKDLVDLFNRAMKSGAPEEVKMKYGNVVLQTYRNRLESQT